MLSPPSLDPAVGSRGFHARNGELGVLLEDAASFLAACREDHLEVLGWELWVVDHAWGQPFNGPVPAPGLWCGGIPVKGHKIPAVYGFDGNADGAERRLASLDLSSEILPEWLPHVRLSFTLEKSSTTPSDQIRTFALVIGLSRSGPTATAPEKEPDLM